MWKDWGGRFDSVGDLSPGQELGRKRTEMRD